MRKLRRTIKKSIAPILIATSLSGIGAGIAGGGTALLPVNILADEVNETDFNSALTEAKNTPHLDVTTTKKTVTVSSAAEAQGLVDIETAKLQNATNTQRINNNEYEQLANDPTYLVQSDEPTPGFSKANIIDLLTDYSGRFNYADVNVLATKHKQKEVFYQNPEIVLEDNNYNWVHATVGDYVLFKNVFTDKKTGKKVDMKVSVTSVENENAVYDLQWNNGILSTLAKEDGTGSDNVNRKDSFIRYKAEFFEAGTNTPITVSVISLLDDIDKNENYKAITPFYKNSVSDINETTIINSNSGFLGTTNSEELEHGSGQQRGLYIQRDINSFEFEWNFFYFSWMAPDLTINEPELKETSVNVIEYSFKQKASFSYVDSNGNQLATPTNLTGEAGTNIPTTEVVNKIDNITNKGWDTTYRVTPEKFDDDLDFDQNTRIVFTPHIETITPDSPKKKDSPTDRSEVTYPAGVDEKDLNKTVTRTINYVYEDGTQAKEPVVQTVKLTRTATFNYVTGEVTYSDWTTDDMAEVKTPVIDNYTYDKSSVPAQNVTVDSTDSTVTVTYKKIPQKGSVSFKDESGKDVAPKKELNGYQAEPFNYNPNDTISSLENKGWDVTGNDFPYNDPTYDKDTSVDQDYTVNLKPHIETINPDNPKEAGTPTDRAEVTYPDGISADDLNKTITRTIKYVDEGGTEIEPVVQTVKLTRTAQFNYVTGEITYSDWTTADVDEVVTPELEDRTWDIEKVDAKTYTAEDESEEIVVTYKKIPQKAQVKFLYGDEEISDTANLEGFNKEPIEYDPTETIESLKNKGYDLIENGYPEDAAFDTDTETDQEFKVTFTPHIEKITVDNPKAEGDETDRTDVKYAKGLAKEDLSKTVTRTIKYQYADGTKAAEDKLQSVELTRDAYFNYVTGEVEYGPWSEKGVESVESPTIDGYTADKTSVDAVNSLTDNVEEVVTYTAIPAEPTEEPAETVPETVKVVNTGDTKATPFIISAIAAAGGIVGAAIGLNKKRKKG